MTKRFVIFVGLIIILFFKINSIYAAELMSPYLQAVTKNSVYVLVNTDNQNPITVQYGETIGYGSTAQTSEVASIQGSSSGNIVSYLQKIKLINLKTNTEYHYKTSESADNTFKTAPNEGTSFRFAWMSDIQGGNPTAYNQIVVNVKSYNPQFSLYGGDLADNAYRFKTDFFLSEQLSLIKKTPFFLTWGNHDIYNGVDTNSTFNNIKAFTQSPDSSSNTQDYYSFDYGDLHILVLNAMIDHSVGSPQYNFSQNDLSSTNKKWKIVITHIPAYAYLVSPTTYITDSALRTMTNNIFQPNNVDLVISGHDHIYQRNLVNNINHVILGSAGAGLYDPDNGIYTQKSLKTYSFGIFDVTSALLQMRAFDQNNQEIDRITLYKDVTITPTATLVPIATNTPIPGGSATLPIYDNPGQGIFQCHSNNNISQDFVKGGGVIIRWDKLQPSNNNQLDQTALTALVNTIKRENKKVYLHFQIYYPNADEADSSVLPDWLYPMVQTARIKDFSNVYGEHPVPWNLVYQEKLVNFLGLLSTALTNAGVMDRIEYIEPAIGGMYGSTSLWVRPRELCTIAVAAGCATADYCGSLPDSYGDYSYCNSGSNVWQCLGAKYNQGATAVIEKYLVAFPNLAVLRAGGNCLCGDLCNYTGADSMINKYGMRFMVKGAGIGEGSTSTNCGMHENFSSFCSNKTSMTKCGEEPWLYSNVCKPAGWSGGGFDASTGCGYKSTYNTSLNNEKMSYYCIYSQDLGCNAVDPGSGETINSINEWIAGRAGSQIYITQKGLDANKKGVGFPLTINITWQNQGSAPLVAPLKQGIKWTPAGYKLFVEFVKNGTVAYYQEYDLNPPTNQWSTLSASTPSSTSTTFNIPGVLGGENNNSENIYQVYTGLTDPNGERKRFVLRNTDSANDQTNRRYLISDSFTVIGRNNSACQCPSDKLPKIKGNANCDNYINNLDLDIWRKEKKGELATKTADFNCDETVDIYDLMLWRENHN